MKKRVCILVSLMSLVVFMACLPGVSVASEQISPATTACPDPQKGVVVNLQEASGVSTSLIKQWNCAIIDNSNGVVVISGETITYGTVDYLDVKVYLQHWNGSDWVDVTSRTYSDNNTSYVSGSAQFNVTRGDSYRCRAVHTAKSGSSSQTTTSVTNAITIK
jgi:hypothetical protein